MKAQFFLFNIEGCGEFFSGITPIRIIYFWSYLLFKNGCHISLK